MKENLIRITGMMHQIKQLLPYGAFVGINPNRTSYIYILKEEDLAELAKEFGEKVRCEKTPLDDNPYEWSFMYNGVEFDSLAKERYEDAETTETEV